MVIFRKNKFVYKLYAWLPILFLLFSVLNEFDLNYLTIEYFSFNFPFVLIFYFTLKEYNRFDYLLVFIAGLVNDTVIGTPLGLSSFSYIFVCIFSYYLNIMFYVINNLFTFLLYIPMSLIFNNYLKTIND